MIRLLHEWVARQADKYPDAPAVTHPEQSITYRELEESSNQLARLLRETGCERGDRVALLAPKSIRALVSILAIYKSECIFVPLDPAGPAPRLLKILDSVEARLILAGGPTAKLLQEVFQESPSGSTAVGWLEVEPPGECLESRFLWSDLQTVPARSLPCRSSSLDPAHVLFTSGSTGVPKGVIITHSNVIHFVEWARKYFGLQHEDRVSCHSPLHFDLSTFDIFGAFASGAQLCLVPPELNLFPNKLAEFFRQFELTQWHSVPSILNYMARFGAVQYNDFPALRRVLWCGEVFPTSSLIHWMKRLPHAQFTNLYGPTEATIASSYYTVPTCPNDPEAPIPIGQPCAGEELLVLDGNLQPVPPGETGELYIRGAGLSPGYWKNPQKTNEVFVTNPNAGRSGDRIYKTGDLARKGEDGQFYFIGRADSQIKSRGYRIELGEIETAVMALEDVQECVVTAVDTDEFQGSVICCAYSSVPGQELSSNELRRRLTRVLPSYMVPVRWLSLPKLPTNRNGKIDRKTIKQEFQKHATQVA